MADAPTVIVAGMHRSGTSLVASSLDALGIDMGRELLGGDAFNKRGYFEDISFQELNGRILSAGTQEGDGGHRDWGWTESESFDPSVLSRFDREAAELVTSRADSTAAWGWKDPRNTLLLDFWDRIVDRAVFVLVYRFPWEVADSMQRLGTDVFLRHPGYAHLIWHYYNRRLLDFSKAHADRCLLISADAVIEQPDELQNLLIEKLDLPLSETESRTSRVEPELFGRFAGDDPLIRLYEAAFPKCTDLLRELDTRADLSSRDLWSTPSIGATANLSPDQPKEPPQPEISVVIPCLDHGVWLIEAIASVERTLAATYQLIVVDDGSVDPETLRIFDILEELGHTVIHQPHAGLSAARDRGIAEATSSLVLPLDSDNRLLPGFVEAAVSVLEQSPDVGIVYGDRWDFGKRSGLVSVPEFDILRLLRANYIDACAVYRKTVWEEVGGYDPSLGSWEDWDFWIGAAALGWQFHHLPGPAFDYRVRPESRVSKALQPAFREDLISHIVRKHSDLYQEHLPLVLLAAETDLIELRQRLSTQEASGRADRELVDHMRHLEAQIDKSQKHHATLESYLADLERNLVEKEAALDDAAAWANSLRREVQSLEDYGGRLAEEVAQKQTALDDAAVHAADLQGHQTTLEEYVAKLTGELTDKQTAIDEGASYVLELRTLVSRLEAKSTEMAGREADLEQRIDGLKERLMELESAVESRDAELENIYSSLLWRFLNVFRRTSGAS